MTVECEEFEYCKVKVNYSADSDLVLEKREEVVENLKKANVKVPGFRQNLRNVNTKSKKKNKRKTKKGSSSKSFKDTRAYEAALKKQYRKYIEEQVAKELVAEAYDETLHETKMKPIGYPQIVSSNLDDESFDCEMVFMKKPDFELKQYKGFEVPNPHQDDIPITRAERMLQMLRERHGETMIYGEDDFLQEGDSVSLDIKSVCEGKEIDELTKEGLPYTVGNNTFKEFDHSIYGMKMGEERSFDIVFPEEDHINESVRGKRVTFTVTLNAGTKNVPAALDDDFAKKMGFDSMEKMHADAIGTASAQLERERKQLIVNQVLNRILDAHDFEVPQWFVLMESQNSARELGVNWSDMTEEEIDELNKGSINKLKLSMILDSIRDEEPEAVFSEQEIVNKMRANIMSRGGNPDEVLSSAQQDGSLFGLVARLKDQATIEWLVQQSKVIDESPVLKKPEQEVKTDG